MQPLTGLAPDDHAIVQEVRGHSALRKRLLDMGVTPGAEIAVVRVAPLGDPVEYMVRGYRLSLRRSEAEQVLIDPLEAAPSQTRRTKLTLDCSSPGRRWLR
jgi:Fe2+ transport system protein FeoA